ncbi:MAG TPA: hypothetical protein VGV61_12440, partial [Thermoanaerobaculia bacterium]|nr:hypothetical protein [Thermoanaerobaculia bacterium]
MIRKATATWRAIGALALAATAAAAQTGDPRADELLARLARGEDVTALAAKVAAEPPPRIARPERSSVAADLTTALAALEQIVARPSARGEVDPALAAAVERVRALDLLARDRFAQVRTQLERADIGGEIRARLEEAEATYRARMDPVRVELQALATALVPAKGTTAHGNVSSALRALQARVAALPAAGEPPLLRALSLPYRPEELAPRQPVT